MRIKVFFVSIFFLSTRYSECQNYFNLDFETFEKNTIGIWDIRGTTGYTLLVDTKETYKGGSSFSILKEKNSKNISSIDSGVSLAQILPNKLLKGKGKLKIVAFIKKISNNDEAGIWCRQFNKNDLMIVNQISKSQKSKIWEKVELEIEINENSLQTKFGCSFIGSGQVWFDAFEIYIDGKKFPEASYAKTLPTSKEIRWLNKNIHQISFSENKKTALSLAPLGDIIKDSKIVGIGEPTHGTKEAVQTKLEVFKYLVEKKGFNTFVLESEMSESQIANEYINGSDKYSTKTVIDLCLPILWKSQEIFEILEWMKEYNKIHTNKLSFWGIDMQLSNSRLKNIYYFGSKYDNNISQTILNIQSRLEQITKTKVELEREKKVDTLKIICQNLHKHFSNNESSYLNSHNSDSLRWIKLNIELLIQSLPMYLENSGKNIYRDSCMATNVKWIFSTYPETKMLLSAHNFHVKKDEDFMGDRLFTIFKENYFSIGITTAEGSYSAIGKNDMFNLKNWTLVKPFAGCFEYYLQQGKYLSYFLEIPKSKFKTNNQWLLKTFLMRHIGYQEDGYQFRYETPSIGYDVIIFLKTTTSTTPILK